jgi:tRNA A37 threonylcarbamoyladenosine modification protein TsaB
MYLCIDSSDILKIVFIATLGGRLVRETYQGRSQDISSTLSVFISSVGAVPADIRGIAVVVGEGSFTGTRLASIIANTFAYVYGVRVVGISSSEVDRYVELIINSNSEEVYMSPIYSAKPNIRK